MDGWSVEGWEEGVGVVGALWKVSWADKGKARPLSNFFSFSMSSESPPPPPPPYLCPDIRALTSCGSCSLWWACYVAGDADLELHGSLSPRICVTITACLMGATITAVTVSSSGSGTGRRLLATTAGCVRWGDQGNGTWGELGPFQEVGSSSPVVYHQLQTPSETFNNVDTFNLSSVVRALTAACCEGGNSSWCESLRKLTNLSEGKPHTASPHPFSWPQSEAVAWTRYEFSLLTTRWMFSVLLFFHVCLSGIQATKQYIDHVRIF